MAQQGKCTNFGNCSNADSSAIVTVPDGGGLYCPLCHGPLTAVSSNRSASPIPILAGGIVLSLLLGGGVYKVWKDRSNGPGNNGNAAVNSIPAPPVTPGGDPGASAVPAVPADPANPGDPGASSNLVTPTGDNAPPVVSTQLLMYYEKSLKKWLDPAIDEVNKASQGKGQISLQEPPPGSRAGMRMILDGKGKPTIWNPADMYWTAKLKRAWQDPQHSRHQGEPFGGAEVQPILGTRIVFVMWKDRARIFQEAMRRPEYRNRTWHLMHVLATRGWSAVGGEASWGRLKLAQTAPTESNSGQVTLALMFDEYRRSHPGTEPASPAFQTWMRAIEDRVPKFQSTTGKTLEAFLESARSEYDMAISYEVNTIAAADEGNPDIKVVYPEPTMKVSFPGAILKGAPWVSPEQAKDAEAVVKYLLARPLQQRASAQGFRPPPQLETEMNDLTDEAFATAKRRAVGLRRDVTTTIERPVSTVDIDSLVFAWKENYER